MHDNNKKGSFIHYFIYFLHIFVLVFLITRHYKASESCQQLFTLTSPFQPLPAPPPISPPSNSNKKDSSAPTSSLSSEGVAMDVITTDVQGEETWDDRRYLPKEILTLSTDEILTGARLIDNDIKVIF